MNPAAVLHEASHAVVGRALGIPIIEVTPDYVTTMQPSKFPATEEMSARLLKLAIIDLAATEIEPLRNREEDELNALGRVGIVASMFAHPETDDVYVRGEVLRVLEQVRRRATRVDNNRDTIERVAAALADGNVLDQDAVDALMVGDKMEEPSDGNGAQ